MYSINIPVCLGVAYKGYIKSLFFVYIYIYGKSYSLRLKLMFIIYILIFQCCYF